MKILASYHIKGGVGKTATAVNLSFLSARDGLRTLVWDLDPQGSATFYFRVKPKVKGGAKGLLKRRRGIEGAIRGSDFEGLDLLPADFSYRKLDVLLDRHGKPERVIRAVLGPLERSYDLIIIDCPPGVSLTTLAVLHAADVLAVPVIPTVLSLETLRRLRRFVRKKEAFRGLAILPFFSMVDRRKSLHRQIVGSPPEDVGPFLLSSIPYASDVERMGIHRLPLGSFASGSPAGMSYERLWTEIREKVNLPAGPRPPGNGA